MNMKTITEHALDNKRGLFAKLCILTVALVLALTLAACGSGASAFSIEGKWKNTGKDTCGQMQVGAIVTFDGSKCNVISPSDTYAFYEENGKYRLDVTGLLGGSSSFVVTIDDNDHIGLSYSTKTIELTRVG